MPRERAVRIDKRLWATPQSFFDRLDAVYNFEIDVCAEESTAKCGLFYNEEADALISDWGEHICFMNPPYGNPEFPCKTKCKKKRCKERGFHSDKHIPGIEDWMRKAWLASINGATVVGLLPSSWGTRWWHDYVMQAETLIIVEGRIKFEYEGKVIGSPDFDSIVAVWKPPTEPGSPAFPTLTTMKAYL